MGDWTPAQWGEFLDEALCSLCVVAVVILGVTYYIFEALRQRWVMRGRVRDVGDEKEAPDA